MEVMTGKKTPDRDALGRLADVLVEDILTTPDESILAEFRESGGDPDRQAAEMLELFETTILLLNKGRLAVAKAGASKANKERVSSKAVVDLAEARMLLRAIGDRLSVSGQLTLAARKESELSDDDVLRMLEAFHELGISPTENSEGGQS